jgi:hypothetical protein
MDGWMGGWMAGKAGLRIAYSNQKFELNVPILQIVNQPRHYGIGIHFE